MAGEMINIKFAQADKSFYKEKITREHLEKNVNENIDAYTTSCLIRKTFTFKGTTATVVVNTQNPAVHIGGLARLLFGDNNGSSLFFSMDITFIHNFWIFARNWRSGLVSMHDLLVKNGIMTSCDVLAAMTDFFNNFKDVDWILDIMGLGLLKIDIVGMKWLPRRTYTIDDSKNIGYIVDYDISCKFMQGNPDSSPWSINTSKYTVINVSIDDNQKPVEFYFAHELGRVHFSGPIIVALGYEKAEQLAKARMDFYGSRNLTSSWISFITIEYEVKKMMTEGYHLGVLTKEEARIASEKFSKSFSFDSFEPLKDAYNKSLSVEMNQLCVAVVEAFEKKVQTSTLDIERYEEPIISQITTRIRRIIKRQRKD